MSVNYTRMKLSVFRIKILVLLMGAILLSSCATQKQIKTEENAVGPEAQNIVIKEEFGIDEEFGNKFSEAVDLIKAEKYDDAIPLLEEVVANSKRHSAPFVNLGIAYMATGNIEKAEQNLQKAIEISPNHPVAINELALLYRKSGRFKEAKALYENLLAKYPLFLPARKNLGILCDLFMKDLECALENYSAYMEVEVNDAQVYLWLKDVKNRLGVK